MDFHLGVRTDEMCFAFYRENCEYQDVNQCLEEGKKCIKLQKISRFSHRYATIFEKLTYWATMIFILLRTRRKIGFSKKSQNCAISERSKHCTLDNWSITKCPGSLVQFQRKRINKNSWTCCIILCINFQKKTAF